MTSTDPLPKPDLPRRLSLRAPLDLLFLLCCFILTADVLGPEFFGHNGKTKDYALWYWAGQQVLHGAPLYPSDVHHQFDFIYPPLSAILLAIPSWFGKIALYTVLSILNALAWWYTGTLSNVMSDAGTKNFIELTASIVSAYVGNNPTPAAEIPNLISQVHGALVRVSSGRAEAVPLEPAKPAVSLKKSIAPDYLVCLEDGKRFKSLKRHLRTQYNMMRGAGLRFGRIRPLRRRRDQGLDLLVPATCDPGT